MNVEVKEKQKVYVGLSGGVDSSVSALLLKEAGYEVVGVFIKGWQPDWIPCTWKIDRISAMRTAAHLEIPFLTLDLENEYKDKVVTYLLEEYKKGNTPNPDMLCNREIKFGTFLKWAIRNGADFVATGHYAQVNPPSRKVDLSTFREGGFVMHESADKEKDQSYFLSQLTQKELSHVLFPIGHLQKSQVRKIAAANNLPVATRKDSQGICFVGDLEMADFLKRELNPQKGEVLNEDGEVIGEHEGAIIYTIGQRHGFIIKNKTENQKTLYVVSKDLENNTITVGERINKSDIKSNKEIQIRNFSFTGNLQNVENAKSLTMRIRYRGEKNKIKFLNYNSQTNFLIIESEKDLDFAHGQFAVLYDGETCLGGGEL